MSAAANEFVRFQEGVPGAPDQIDRMWKFAERIADSKFIKPAIRGDVPSVFHQLAIGEELGLLWTHSARGIYLGKSGGVGMTGDVILALLLAKGFKVEFTPLTDPVIGFTCTITRPEPDSTPVSRSFTMTDAGRIKTEYDQQAKKWHVLSDQFNYINYPEQMCQWRSLANCGRVAAADVMGGIYLPEELAEASGSSAPAAEPGPTDAAPVDDDEFTVGEKPVETAAGADIQPDKPADVPPVTAAAPAVTVGKPVDIPTLPAAVANVVEMPAPKPEPIAKAAPAIDYRLHLAIKTAGKEKPELVACGAEAPQADKDAATLRARAVATEKKMPCVVLKFIDGKANMSDPESVVVVCNPPSASAPALADPADATGATPTFDEMIALIDKQLGGDPKANHKLLAAYFKGFLQTQTVPKDREKLDLPLRKLVTALDRVGELRTDAAALGNSLAGRAKSALDDRFDLMNWSPNVRELARKVQTLLGQDETNFIAWLELPIAADGFSLSSMDPAGLEVFLPMFLLAKGRAFEVIDMAIAQQRGVAATLQEVANCAGRPVSEWDAPFTLRILDEIKKVAQDEPAAQNAPPAPDEDDGFLTGGLPFGS